MNKITPINLEQEYIKIQSALSTLENDNSRKRLYVSKLGINALAGYLTELSFSVNSDYIYDFLYFLNDYDMAPLLVNQHVKIDVRAIVGEDYPQMWIPKSHSKLSIEPDFYAGIRFNKQLDFFEIVGFAENSIKNNAEENKNYFIINKSQLKNIAEIKSAILDIPEKMPQQFTIDHNQATKHYFSLLDKKIALEDKNLLLSHVLTCERCKFDFAKINKFSNMLIDSFQYKNANKLDVLDIQLDSGENEQTKDEEIASSDKSKSKTNINIVPVVFAPVTGLDAVSAVSNLSGAATEIVGGVTNLTGSGILSKFKKIFSKGNNYKNKYSEVLNQQESEITPLNQLDRLRNEITELNNSKENESYWDNGFSESTIKDTSETIVEDKIEVLQQQETLDELAQAEDNFDLLKEPINEEDFQKYKEDLNNFFDCVEDTSKNNQALTEIIETTEIKDFLDVAEAQTPIEQIEKPKENVVLLDLGEAVDLKDSLSDVKIDFSKLEDEPLINAYQMDLVDTCVRGENLECLLYPAIQKDVLQDLGEVSLEEADCVRNESLQCIIDSNKISEQEILPELSDLDRILSDLKNIEVVNSFEEYQQISKGYSSSDISEEQDSTKGSGEIEILEPPAELEKDSAIDFINEYDANEALKEQQAKQLKLIKIAGISILAGVLLVSVFTLFAKKPDETSVLKNSMPITQQQPTQIPVNHVALTPSTPQNGSVQPIVNTLTPAVSVPSQKDMNQILMKAFVAQGEGVAINNVSWEVGMSLANDGVFKNYLMLSGQAIKLALSKNLSETEERASNSKVKAEIVLDLAGNIKQNLITSSSGSAEIDDIITKTISDTLSFTRLPKIDTKKKYIKAILVINL